MPSVELTICNKRGLHARAAAKFAAAAADYACDIKARTGEQWVDGKSVMSLMMLAASKGHTLEVRTEGEDAEAALSALTALIKNKFEEGE